jgi:hypothetical protein
MLRLRVWNLYPWPIQPDAGNIPNVETKMGSHRMLLSYVNGG